MIIKLISDILALSIELIGLIFALSMDVLPGVIFALLLKKPYAGGKVGKCHSYSIKESVNRCYSCITIENH